MGQFFNVVSFQQSGEPWSNEHGTYQTYWADMTDDQGNQYSAMMSKKVGNTPAVGRVFGNLEVRTSQKGNQYYKFNSEKNPTPQGGQGQPAPQYATNAAQLATQAPLQPVGQQPTQQFQQPQQAPMQPQPQQQPQYQQPPVQPGAIVGDGIPGWAVPLYNMVTYIYKEMKAMETPDEPVAVNNGSFSVPDEEPTTEMPPEVAAAFGGTPAPAEPTAEPAAEQAALPTEEPAPAKASKKTTKE